MIKAGGLHIVGTERHESRRIDNQLRGRAGRQGDPGSSRFYLSLEDPLLRIFGGERLGGIMQKLKMPEGEPIEHPIVNRSIAKAQNRVESRNFDIRKQLLEYDDVANDQRKVIYQQRNELLESTDVGETIENMVRGEIDDVVRRYVPPESIEDQWDVKGLETALQGDYGVAADVGDVDQGRFRDHRRDASAIASSRSRVAQWKEKEALAGAEVLRQFERSLMLQSLDQHWREHLANLDHLRQGIHLRGYAQKNPKQEYKREAFELFSDMLDRIKHDVVKIHADRAGPHAAGRAGGRRAAAGDERALPARRLRGGARATERQRRRRYRRRDGAAEGGSVRTRGREDRSQRPVSVRQREEVQAMSRAARLSAEHWLVARGRGTRLPVRGIASTILGVRTRLDIRAATARCPSATPRPRLNRCCRSRASRSALPPRASRTGSATTSCS